MTKSVIPSPPKEEVLEPDHSKEWLKEWKRLFNAVRPGIICAYIKGDKGFPREYTTTVNMSRLSDGYNVEYLLVVKGFPHEWGSEFSGGTEIYCCEYDSAFASGWVSELDENMDTLDPFEPVSWEVMLKMVIENEKKLRTRTPRPPE